MAERTVVVGAGIVGASVAHALTSRDVDVTLIDSALPGSDATGASFGWIGRPLSSTGPAAGLRARALEDWRRLEREVPALHIEWTGAVCWGSYDDGDGELADLGRLEPRLLERPEAARFHAEDGALDSQVVTEQLVHAARERGARVLLGDPALTLERRGDSVVGVRTIGGVLEATTVVLAAGVGCVALCHGIGVDLPVRPDPAVLVRLRAEPGLIRTIIASDDIEIRQAADGVLLVPLPYSGERTRDALTATAEAAAARVRSAFASADSVGVLSSTIGWRPMPVDGEPVIGRVASAPGLYLTVMHSGVTLAASAGRLAAEEIDSGRDSPDLAGCRLDRFT